MSDETLRCRDDLHVPSTHRKDGQLRRKTNRFATRCSSCGDQLAPGEAIVGGRGERGAIRWVCGARRWRRP